MHLIYSVLAGLALLAVIIGLTKFCSKLSKKREGERTAAELEGLHRFIEKTMEHDGDARDSMRRFASADIRYALDALGFPRLRYSQEAFELLQSVRNTIKIDDQYEQYHQRMAERWETLKSHPDDTNVMYLGLDLAGDYRRLCAENELRLTREIGITAEGIYEELRRYFDAECSRMLLEAETDYDVFLELKDLLRYASKIGRSYPDNWFQIVAFHMQTPDLDDFGISRPMNQWNVQSHAELRNMAAEALRDKDVTLGKLVLAYVDSSHHFREKLGHVLIADLAKMIARAEKTAKVDQPKI